MSTIFLYTFYTPAPISHNVPAVTDGSEFINIQKTYPSINILAQYY